MFTTINNFNQIELSNKKTLIICDIDETLFYWNKKTKDFYHMLKNDYNMTNNKFNLTDDEIEKEAFEFLNTYKCSFPPTITDPEGFKNLLNNINSSFGSKIIFLTARTSSPSTNNKFTRKHFEINGLEYDNFDIHYTNNLISKGEYIKEYIDLKDWDEIIFIDDYEEYIKSVKDIFPNIKCYKFKVLY